MAAHHFAAERPAAERLKRWRDNVSRRRSPSESFCLPHAIDTAKTTAARAINAEGPAFNAGRMGTGEEVLSNEHIPNARSPASYRWGTLLARVRGSPGPSAVAPARGPPTWDDASAPVPDWDRLC